MRDDNPDAASDTVATESNGFSVHTLYATCAFHRGTPPDLTLADPNAGAFAKHSWRVLHLREHLVRVYIA